MTTMEVDFLSVHCRSMIVATRGFLTKSLGLASADEIVQVEYVKVIKSLLTVPTTEDVQIVADLVARVGCPAGRWIVLGHRGEPSHIYTMRYLSI